LHILQTNLLHKGYSLLEVLTTYKEQYHAEFSFRDLQGPMAVSPIFLHTPERIQVLLFLIVVALMLYVLLAREVLRGAKLPDLKTLFAEEGEVSSSALGCPTAVSPRLVTWAELAGTMGPQRPRRQKVVKVPDGQSFLFVA